MFRRAANLSRVNVGAAKTVCKGTLQLSSNGFVKCVPIAAVPIASSGHATFTVSPAAPLATGTTYKIGVTTGAQASGRVPLATQFMQVGIHHAVTSDRVVPGVSGVKYPRSDPPWGRHDQPT